MFKNSCPTIRDDTIPQKILSHGVYKYTIFCVYKHFTAIIWASEGPCKMGSARLMFTDKRTWAQQGKGSLGLRPLVFMSKVSFVSPVVLKSVVPGWGWGPFLGVCKLQTIVIIKSNYLPFSPSFSHPSVDFSFRDYLIRNITRDRIKKQRWESSSCVKPDTWKRLVKLERGFCKRDLENNKMITFFSWIFCLGKIAIFIKCVIYVDT